MKYFAQDMGLIQRFALEMRGVFTINDLELLFKVKDKSLYDRVNYLCKHNILRKVIRGLYATSDTNIERIASRINFDSYISSVTILAENLMIGTTPKNKIYCIKKNKAREYKLENTIIEYKTITEDLYFGFSAEDGIKKANVEKALLDMLYYYQFGEKYFFNIYQDVDISSINRKKLLSYLERYKNPKFKKFVYDYIAKRN